MHTSKLRSSVDRCSSVVNCINVRARINQIACLSSSCNGINRPGGIEKPPHSPAHAFLWASSIAVMLNISTAFPTFAASDASSVVAKAMEEYVGMESKGQFKDIKTLDKFRDKYKFRRLFDGRVQVKSKSGEWYTAKLDMQVPGAVLLRDKKGHVSAVQTDGLQQVDLSDDYIVLMMFADGKWEQEMSPVEYLDSNNKVQQVLLTEKEFRDVLGILNELEDDD